MRCPHFREAYVGVCNASPTPCAPSVADMERYCFTDHFASCPVFVTHKLTLPRHMPRKEVRTRHDLGRTLGGSGRR
jgi:hypothetical protein